MARTADLSKALLRPLTLTLSAFLSLSACAEEGFEDDEFEAFEDEGFRSSSCTNLSGGVRVCEDGYSVDIRGNNDKNELIVTTYFDHDAGDTWVAVNVQNNGYYCALNCIWTGAAKPMHPAHVADANLWHWNYFSIDIHLEKGGDKLRGRTIVKQNGSSTTVNYLDAEAWGQGGGDDIRYVRIVDGGDGDDLIVGTNRSDILKGGEQADTIYGAGGNDDMWGQRGGDDLIGGPGNDDMDGGKGDDYCDSSEGNDSRSSCQFADIVEPGYAFWQDDIFH